MNEIQPTITSLAILTSQIREMKVRSEERLKACHGRFNVFTILRSHSDEVHLHTKFLYELLNPKGTHDCGGLFLKLFFETLEELKAVEHDGDDTSESWKEFLGQDFRVFREIRTPQGQLDLLLESDTHYLVIENKIYAQEQGNQVARYCEYGESQKGKKGHVLYLTLDGKTAYSHNGRSYLRISYKEHILEWIERCLKATYHIVPINQVLIQYKNVLKQLTGQAMEAEMIDQIKDYILKHPEVIAHRKEIDQGIAAVRVYLLNRFADELTKRLKDQYTVTRRPGMDNDSFGEDPNGGLVLRDKENDITMNHSFEIWVEHTNKWDSLVIGIESKWQKKWPIPKDEEIILNRMNEKLIRYCDSVENKIHHGQEITTWGGDYWPTRWHDLIQGFMRKDPDSVSWMLNKDNFNLQVDEAVKEIDLYMDILKKIYDEVKTT